MAFQCPVDEVSCLLFADPPGKRWRLKSRLRTGLSWGQTQTPIIHRTLHAWAETWRRVWGGQTEKLSPTKRPFFGKISVIGTEHSDDLIFIHRPYFVCLLPVPAV